MSLKHSPDLQKNRLLAALTPEDRERLLPMMEVVSMQPKDMIYEAQKPIEYVYFPLSGVASLMAVMDGGELVEVGTVGNEGMVGIPIFLGSETTNGVAFWQVPGETVRMPAKAFRKELDTHLNGTFVRTMQRYMQAVFTMLAQHTACNRIHTIKPRCARWLLMTHDRVEGDEFLLTQEFLGQMLGVRRASVNEVMQELQQAEILCYKRGIVSILDRDGLEGLVCECYGIIKNEFDRLLK